MFHFKNVQYKTILNIPELAIEGQQTTCILGESGSGKSTLLRLMNKLISPDYGEIYYNETLLEDLNAVLHRRSVVMLPQAPVIFPGTIRDNLLIGLKFTDQKPEIDQKLSSLLTWLNLPDKLDSDCDTLSGGEKQRLSIGRIILMNPDVYLLDEPSSALDEKTAQAVVGRVVQHVRDHGKTLIVVTHSQQIAETFADMLIELQEGAVMKQEDRTK